MVLGFGFATSLATRCALQTAETIIRCTGRTAGRGARLVNRVSFARTSAPFVSEVDNNSHEQGVAVQRLAAQQRAKACTLGVTLPQLAVHEQAQRSSARSSVAGLPSMFTHSAASTAGMQKSGSEKVVDASGLIIAHKGDSGVGQYKAARPQVLSSMSKQRQFGRLKPHQTCCICQGQPVPHALAAAKQRIKKLERQVLRLSKTISHQGKKPKALWEEVRLQDKWVCREATTAEKAVGHASRSSATARVDHEDPASTSGSSEAAPSFIQSALHINATAGSLAQSARLPQTSGRARQLTYHESALSVQACQEIIMARLSADKSSCLALVVQSPLAAAHGKADAARVAIMAGKFHDAVILCKEGLNMKPEDAYVRACLYHNRGLAYSCLGQPILTIGDCSMAHRLSPLLWQPVYHRYLAYDAIGATRDALKDLKMVKQLGHPISWEDMFYLRWSHRYKPHQIQSEQVLGVAGIARDERKGAARAAFKKLSLMYHPDKAATDQKEIAKQLYEYIRAAIDELG
ncbi:hypothetical protein WJX79_002081 [Trebouxia sp. C0005]